MKTVFNNSELCHVYNQQSQPTGRGNSMYFNGPSLYSYGEHFKICEFVEHNGKRALMFTLREYSNTTSKHKSYAFRACRDREIIYCYYPGSAYHDNFLRWGDRFRDIKNKLPKARKLSKYYQELQIIYNQAKIYADFLEIELPEYLEEIQTILNNPEAIEKIRKQQQQEAAQKEAATIARQSRERREAAEQAREFLKGERSRVSAGELDFLRVQFIEGSLLTENSYILTSQGVKIPYNVARQFYQAIKYNQVKIGDKLEQFTVNKLDDKFINIGCHRFTRRQLLNFGNSIFQS